MFVSFHCNLGVVVMYPYFSFVLFNSNGPKQDIPSASNGYSWSNISFTLHKVSSAEVVESQIFARCSSHFPSSERATTKVVPPPSTPTSLIFCCSCLVRFLYLPLSSLGVLLISIITTFFLFFLWRERVGDGERGLKKAEEDIFNNETRVFVLEDKKIEEKLHFRIRA